MNLQGKTALVTNEFAYSSSGPVGSALNLTRTADANNGLILDATVPLGSNWTVSCWFNELRSPGDWRTLLRGPTAEHQVLVENNSDRVGSYMGGYFPAGGATLPTGATWRHITIVGGNNTMTVYVNGQLMGSGNVQPTEDVKGIGFYQGGAQKFANALDEFRIESYSRSSNWVWACWLNMASNSTFNTCQAIRLF